MIENLLTDKILEQGVLLSYRQKLEIKRQIRNALLTDNIQFIFKNGKFVGFFTIQKNAKSIFINNLCIFKEFRNHSNLLYLRKLLRGMYPETKIFHWQNRKHNKEMFFN